ncbi:MAG TPA: hypothetical protein VJ932_12455 [Alkalispirochaeta sp.]|nr:hypothetical protein [Alkalispirochaeta sp.]
MSHHTPIYGHSRGYRALAFFSIAVAAVLVLGVQRGIGIGPVRIAGVLGFTGLFFYAWRRFSQRHEVLRIEENGFSVQDPAQPIGLIEFDEIEEMRIYALRERPTVAFRLHDADSVRRRGPALLRCGAKYLWQLRTYQVVVELDAWNDQVAAVKSVAVKAGIPIRSELI